MWKLTKSIQKVNSNPKKTDSSVNINQLTVKLKQFINQFVSQLINNWFLCAVFLSSLVIARISVIYANSLLIDVNLLINTLTNSLGFYLVFFLSFFFFLALEGKGFVFNLGGLVALSFPGVFEHILSLGLYSMVRFYSMVINSMVINKRIVLRRVCNVRRCYVRRCSFQNLTT